LRDWGQDGVHLLDVTIINPCTTIYMDRCATT
jgi:hypothetical protein